MPLWRNKGRTRLLQLLSIRPQMYRESSLIHLENNHSRIDPAEVLLELQSNAGDPPFEDQILEALEEIVQEKLSDAD